MKSEMPDDKKSLKRRMSIDEIAKLQKLLTAGMSFAEIAKKLGRPEDTIKEAVARLRDQTLDDRKEDFIAALHRKHYWPQIQRSLKDSTEITYFESEWASLMSQLEAQDVVHTDVMMMRDLVLQDINCFRITAATAEIHRRKEQLEKLIYDELLKDADERDLTQVQVWRTEISAYTAALVALVKEQSDTQSRKEILFKNLRSTRDQRHKQLQESNKDLFSLIMAMDETTRRDEEGRHAELVNMAADKVRKDWSKPREFADGTVDSILLSAESMDKLKDGEDKDDEDDEEDEEKEKDEEREENEKSEESKESEEGDANAE